MPELRPVPLSVLDLAPLAEDATPSQAVRASIGLAQAAEDLGYTRFWLAEHHGMPGVASSAPPILIGAVAAATRRLRVGSGGVMLPNHAPLVVAEQFSTLAALHPGRIDLGLGRAPGTDPATAAALRRGELDSADRFPDELAALLAHLGLTEGGGRRLATPPLEGPLPIWLLGSSGFSAELAGLIGLPFAFAHHFSAGGTVQALQLYRRSFRPSVVLDRPYAAIGVQVVCGEDDRHAQELARPSALSFIRLRQGFPSRMPTPQAAAEHRWTAQEQAFVLQRQAEQAVGGPETVRARLADLLERTGADELIVTTAAHDPADRARSLARTRELFGEAELPRGLDAA